MTDPVIDEGTGLILYAIPADVEAVYGPLTDSEAATLPARLLEASNKARLLCRTAGIDLDALVQTDPVAALAAKTATVNAVVRALRNPEGLRQFSVSSSEGEFSATDGGTFDTANSTGAIYIDPGDLAGILPDQGGRVGSIRLGMGLA